MTSQNVNHGSLHRGIRSDGGRRGERRKRERDVIREQASEGERRNIDGEREQRRRDRETVRAENHLALS